MDNNTKIKRLLQGFSPEPNLPITATVVSIEKDTCTVKLASGLVLSDVRLKATVTDDEDSFLIIPKVDSEVVLMSQTGTLNGLMVIKVNAVERFQYKKGKLEFIIDGKTETVTLKKDKDNFGTLISNLITEISNAIIFTPTAGPGSISSTTKKNLTELDNKFKTILK